LKRKNLIKDCKKDAKVSWTVPIFGLMVFFVISYIAYLSNINSGTGYNQFSNWEFGTNATIEVAPHGIYTDKYIDFNRYQKVPKEIFIETALTLNRTIYYEGYNRGRFWIQLTQEDVTQNNFQNMSFESGKMLAYWNYIQHPYGYWYEVPFRWY